MTTKEAAIRYEKEHLREWGGVPFVVYNPHGKPEAELPTVFGFNNGGSPGWFSAISITEDGTVLGGHICSSEAYMSHDLGLLEGIHPTRQEHYRSHYPYGYRTEFVSYEHTRSHTALKAAIDKHQDGNGEENSDD